MGEWTPSVTDDAWFESLRYARVAVAVGRHPDDPELIARHMIVDTDAGHVCLLDAARHLREAADQLEATHEGMC